MIGWRRSHLIGRIRARTASRRIDTLTDPPATLSPLESPEDAVALVPQPSRDEALLHTLEQQTGDRSRNPVA